MKKLGFFLSSYFFDRELMLEKSSFNNELKVVLRNGKVMLNSGEANYSFGNLHRLFQSAFAKTKLQEKNIKTALILGFGAGSVANILHKELKINCTITGVEIDRKVIQIAKHYFGSSLLENTNIVEYDAYNFMEKNTCKFDLIVIDLFKELNVPDKFCEIDFLLLTKNALNKDGCIYFNFVAENTQQKKQLIELLSNFETVFENSRSLKMDFGNRILTNA